MKKKLKAILLALGLIDKAKNNELNSDDWKKIEESYKETHDSDFYADMEAEKASAEKSEEDAKKAEQHDAVLALLNANAEKTDDNGEDAGAGANQKTPTLEQSVQTLASTVAEKEAENKELRTALEKAGNQNPETVDAIVNVTGAGMGHTESHLFGIQESIFATDRRYNSIFLNPRTAKTMEEPDEDHVQMFTADFNAFSKKMQKAIIALHSQNQLNSEFLRNYAANPNLDALEGAGLGQQFVQFRTRELMARIFELDEIRSIFPTRSGVQDRELMTNAFVEELTQSWQNSEGAVKGASSLDPELGYVDDCMILTKFEAYKRLEREYIAYLNTNGSSPVKWSMIEWTMEKYMKKAMNEYNERSVRGIFIKPILGTPGYYLNAATGMVNRICLYNAEKKVSLFEDAAFASYDPAVGTEFIDYLEELGLYLQTTLDPLGVNVEKNLVIYANKNHKPYYRSGYRSKYGLQTDMKGVVDDMLQDTQIRIVWVPNMGSLAWAFASPIDNLQTLEYIPGEMFKFYFERRLNDVLVQSTWKEGTTAGFAGRKVATNAALNADAHLDEQWIWAPKPYTAVVPDAVTVDATDGFWFLTGINTVATDITAIQNPKAGAMYIIECGDVANASTVTKAGVFSEITANWVPTVIGDKLILAYRASTGKFEEVARVVADGAIVYNADVAPNAIGVR